MGFEAPESKVEWNEGGPTIGGFPASEEMVRAKALASSVDGFPSSDPFTSSGQKNNTSSSGSGGGAGGVVAFVAAAAVGIWGVSALLDDKPASRTNTPSASAPAAISPPLVKGAFYKLGHGNGIAFVDGGDKLLQRTFTKQACIVVTDPMPLMGTTLVKIDLPQPGLNNIPAYTDGRKLQYAPECYERRMP